MKTIPSDENELLRSEIRTAREAADITAQLVIKQFEETYQVLQRLETANENLHTSEENHRLTLELSPEPIIVYDAVGQVKSVNRAFVQTFGWQISEMRDNTAAFVPPDRQVELQEITARGYQDGQIQDIETQRYTRAGRLLDVQLSAAFVRGKDNRLNQVIVIMRNITERKRMEEELRQARDDAEAANASKSAFLAMMSHEIRTPMNAVIGMSGLLLDTGLTSEQREFAEIIRTSGDALLSIINDILDFSKIEAGKMDLESQPFDLREAVESALDLVTPRAVEKGLDIAYSFENDVPPSILGDVARLRQILINLLGNSLKFTEQGEVVLTVSRDPLDPVSAGPDDILLHFTIRDTGIGIQPDQMGRLFQSFSQADSSTSRKYGGTGLGLVISKRIAGMMGGNMWAESSGVKGQGTTFHFTIRTRAIEMPASSHRDLREIQLSLEGKRVLVVDDNATNRRILSLQLHKWGMLARASETPEEALQWIRHGNPFDLAILDMNMPEMDGVTLARKIRELDQAARLPLVLFSSLGQRVTGAGTDLFSAFLSKPIKPSQLFDMLAGIFSATPAPEKRNARVQVPRDAQMGKHHPLRILLAEDVLVNQKLALRMLEQVGYHADVAANGLEVLQSLQRQTYDLILMDVQMPEMDGLEASRQICARWPRGQRPTIIAMTANAMQGDREICLEAGMDDYVSKPIRMDELIKAIANVVPVQKNQT